MEYKKIPCNPNNYGKFRPTSDIKYIVIHYTANNGDTAIGNGSYFRRESVGASAHLFVDENNVVMSVPFDVVAYSVGGALYKNTKGGKFYQKCNNKNSVSIEMCSKIKNGKFYIPKETIDNAIEITKELMDEFDIPIDRVIRHYDVNGKTCPEPFVRNADLWMDFKERLVDEVKEPRFNNINEVPDWAKPTVQKLIDKKAIADPNNLDLSLDMIRMIIILERLG